MPDPKELGELIDDVADRLEVLEREHSEFFERWHGERRKREKLTYDVDRCLRILLSEPDTKGALFKTESILREALEFSRKPPDGEGQTKPAWREKWMEGYDSYGKRKN